MKNYTEFWSEHPYISTFWLIVHIVTVLALTISIPVTLMLGVHNQFYNEDSHLRKFLNRMKTKIKNLK